MHTQCGFPDWANDWKTEGNIMKKILFATTALVASAGFAAAEVKISGNAEMGIAKYGNDYTGTTGVDEGAAVFVSNVDIDFALRGESDNGISFGADIDLDEAGATSNSKEAVFVQAGGLKVTMGDTDGALDARLAEPFLAGSSINDDETDHGAAMNADIADKYFDGQVLRVDYTFSGVTVSASAIQGVTKLQPSQDMVVAATNDAPDLATDAEGGGTMTHSDPMYGIGVSYDANLGGVDMNFALAYQSGTVATATDAGAAATTKTDVDMWGATVAAFFGNGFSAAIGYGELKEKETVIATGVSTSVTTEMWNIGFGYEQGPIAVGINYGESDPTGANNTTTGWGLAASYDFGGGLSANFGYGSTDGPGANTADEQPDYDTYSLGLRMKF